MLCRLAAALMLSVPAFAGQVTVTVTSPAVPLTTATTGYPWGATLSTQIPKFDHTLGVLDSYVVVETVQYAGVLRFENQYASTVSYQWPYTIIPGIAYDVSFSIPPFDGTLDYAGPSGTIQGCVQGCPPGFGVSYLACGNAQGWDPQMGGGSICHPILSGSGNYSTAYSDVPTITHTRDAVLFGPIFEYVLVWDPVAQLYVPSTPIHTDVIASVQATYNITYNFHGYPSQFCPGSPNSQNPQGASLVASGTSSVSADTFALAASGLPANAIGLFFQGTTSTFGGVVFGDGVRRVGGSVVRLAVKTASAGQMQYPTAGDLPISVRGLVPASGGYRTYQVWYRDPAPGFGTPATFNITSAVATSWAP